MGYYNPIYAYGAERFVEAAAETGVSGFIIPDLPPEEAAEIDDGCKKYDLGLSYLVAPNSTDDRAGLLSSRSRGFTYLVSVTGITGARDALPPGLMEFVQRVRAVAPDGMPLAVGFGISTPVQARLVGEIADGVIVGSALIDAVDGASDPARAAGEFVRALREGLE
jgi:tryptophan synthase alpha chain